MPIVGTWSVSLTRVDDGEGARLFKSNRVGQESVGPIPAALHLKPTELIDRLRRESHVPAHGDSRVDERLNLGKDFTTALELDRVCPRLHEFDTVTHRVLNTRLVSPKSEVGKN